MGLFDSKSETSNTQWADYSQPQIEAPTIDLTGVRPYKSDMALNISSTYTDAGAMSAAVDMADTSAAVASQAMHGAGALIQDALNTSGQVSAAAISGMADATTGALLFGADAITQSNMLASGAIGVGLEAGVIAAQGALSGAQIGGALAQDAMTITGAVADAAMSTTRGASTDALLFASKLADLQTQLSLESQKITAQASADAAREAAGAAQAAAQTASSAAIQSAGLAATTANRAMDTVSAGYYDAMNVLGQTSSLSLSAIGSAARDTVTGALGALDIVGDRADSAMNIVAATGNQFAGLAADWGQAQSLRMIEFAENATKSDAQISTETLIKWGAGVMIAFAFAAAARGAK